MSRVPPATVTSGSSLPGRSTPDAVPSPAREGLTIDSAILPILTELVKSAVREVLAEGGIRSSTASDRAWCSPETASSLMGIARSSVIRECRIGRAMADGARVFKLRTGITARVVNGSDKRPRYALWRDDVVAKGRGQAS